MKEQISNRDHTYLKTDDNIFFCVGGDLHTEKAIFGQPYYFLRQELEDIMDIQINEFVVIGGQEFTKLRGAIPEHEYPDFIRYNYPSYYYSPPMWEVLMKVDREKITQVLDPKALVRKFRREYQPKQDDENTLLYLLSQVAEFDAALLSNAGITGSLLLHGDLSQLSNDIDLVVYGKSNVKRAHDFSVKACSENPRFSSLTGEKLQAYLQGKASTYPGTITEFMLLTQGRWDTIFIDGMKLDFTFTSGQSSLSTLDMIPVGKRSVKGRIANATGSYYLPTVIDVEGESRERVVVTSRGYGCLLQRLDVVDIHGEEFYSEKTGERCIVVNNNRNGYIARIA